jgi:hypothetical protein
MKVKLVLASAVVFAVGTLLMAGSASAQWSRSIPVSNAVEPDQIGRAISGLSAVRCGTNVVVGFGDSEPGNQNSFRGYSVSTNGGNTFQDTGVLPVSSADTGWGQDVLGGYYGTAGLSLACASPQLFYYASGYVANNPISQFCNPQCSAISLSISTTGGTSWNLPVFVASAFGDTHQLYSPSIGVDPTSPSRMYVAYLETNWPGPFDFGFPECDGNSSVTALRVARSTDGGQTWTINTAGHACAVSTNPETQGTLGALNVVVSPEGNVYLTYEFQPQTSPNPPLPNEIRFTRSLDNGVTFSTAINVSKNAINNTVPQLAVDRTTSKFRGTVYLTWSGMPRGTTTEVLMSDSLDQGASFSFPRSVRATSQGTQVNPVVAVDNDGQVANCYYVTGTNTPTSSSNYFYNCLTSFNHAATWTQYQKLVTSAPPGFDGLTNDFLLRSDGFFTALEVPSSGPRRMVGSKSDLN